MLHRDQEAELVGIVFDPVGMELEHFEHVLSNGFAVIPCLSLNDLVRCALWSRH